MISEEVMDKADIQTEAITSSLEVNESELKPKKNEKGLKRIFSSFVEWRDLPSTIKTYPSKVAYFYEVIIERLIDYRATTVKYSHLADNIDDFIWELYQQIREDTQILNRITRDRPLIFRTLKQLRKLNQSWINLTKRQERLLDSIKKAPSALEFYNKMMQNKEDRKRERHKDEERAKNFAEAYQSLEIALDYVEKYNREQSNDQIEGSALKIENARKKWFKQLEEINQIEQSGETSVDVVLMRLEKLKNTIFETPLAKWIQGIEKRFKNLIDDNTYLFETFNKNVIYNEEYNEKNVIMSELVPKLWANGDREQLEHYIRQVENFISTYEPMVTFELSFAERHYSQVENRETSIKIKKDDYGQYISLARAMISAIESREPHMGEHSLMVAELSVRIAKELKWSEKELQLIEIAGLLHDVGKIWIPEIILNNENPLKEEEFEIIQLHPYYGAKIVESINELDEVIPWIYHHQEKWDGTGYPEGLRNDEIPMAASVIAVCEAYSAMVTNTLNRDALSVGEALDQIKTESGKQFNPEVVEIFIDIINDQD
ncbi:MAG: HD domain-containing protein [Bacteroidales bacterium]|nr:HD domain-containing protein [Bacteroidales bacterium]